MRLRSSLALLLAALPLAAQENPESLQRKAMTDASLRSLFIGALSGIKLEAKEDDKNATAVFSRSEAWHLKLTAPLDKDSQSTTLANLHGLGGKGKLELAAKHRIKDWTFSRNREAWDAACLAHELQPLCSIDELTQKERDRVVHFGGLKTMIGGSLELTRTKFTFLTKPDYSKDSDTHPQYAATLALAALPVRWHLYLASLGYRYESSYEDQDAQNICVPIKDSTATECFNKPVGAPDHKQKHALELETRWFYTDKLVVDPLMAYDFKNNVFGVDVPIYFIPGEKGLDGGVTIGWRSDKKELTAGVFIGAIGDVFK